MKASRALALSTLGWSAPAMFLFAASPPAAPLAYNRDIRPILSENCFACHGPDSAARKAKLRLDHFEFATAPRPDSRPAIVPGRPQDSELVSRIYHTNEDDLMPPPKTHKVLTPAQKDLLKRWIAEGAPYQPHWSLIAPSRPVPPKVRNAKWVRNPIDQFILARLEAEKLQPAPEADRRTLARRVSLDLTGLPPAPGDVEAFVSDKSPDAYEKLVDKFLASPRWGEHRGRYWLDLARYGDTHGIHNDNFREMWSYREWVIQALNRNMPFDQFTIEQLAGDLLPNATLEQQIASGFNRCNITTSEGGAIDEEYLVLYARDRTETTAQVWLGTTAGCAVCHDHKYDPLSQREFYSLSAFFNNTTQKAMDGNVRDTPPIVVVPAPEDRNRWAALTAEKAAGQRRLEDRQQSARPDFEAWLTNAAAVKLATEVPTDLLLAHVPLSDFSETNLAFTAGGAAHTVAVADKLNWFDGAVAAKGYSVRAATTPQFADLGDFERDQAVTFGAWVKLAGARDGAVFARMDEDQAFRGWDLWLEGGRPGTHLIHNWPENAIKVVAKKELPKDRWAHVVVTYNGTSKAKGVKIYVDGELQETEVQADKLKGTIRATVPFKIGQRSRTSAIEKSGVQDVRLYGRALSASEVRELGGKSRLAWLAAKPADQRDAKEGDELFSRWLTSTDEGYRDAQQALNDLKAEENEIRKRGTIAHVMNERETPPEAYLLFRGEYDQRRDKLGPATPAALPPMPPELPRNRLGLAQWLLRPEHPLTARVTVNRFWQELFGTGIVKTAGDFGVAGEMPSHPELLDWLAVEFRESGWDMKKFFRLVVTSATYRQAATVTKEKLAKDPGNVLLARGPRFRMDAEMIRDYALAASGLLVEKIGGRSVKPYQPDGVWEAVAMTGSDTRIYRRDHGEDLYRRSLYTFIKRSAPPAQMEIFNAPNRQTCTVRRERTSTPLQALVTLNDEQFIEAARRLAEAALKSGGAKDAERLDFMAKRLLARAFRPEERRVVERGLKDLLAHYRTEPGEAEKLIAVGESKAEAALDPPTLAAYTMVANQLMNLDEVLNK
jgi:mono/diheme cytochrome c family protein